MKLLDKYVGPLGDWSRRVEVDGLTYHVGVKKDKRVRIPYKPRGTYGWIHYGFVNDCAGRRIWGGKVPGSLGANGLLVCAGILPEWMGYTPQAKRYLNDQLAAEFAQNWSEAPETLRKWIRDTYDERTRRVEAGEVNYDWARPAYRVSWTEVVAKAEELGMNTSNAALVDLRLWLASKGAHV